MNPIELTRQLIDIPSITAEEADVGRFLAGYLERLNYRVEIQEVTKDQFNVIATLENHPRLFFSSHLDTVPPFIPSREDEKFIYGRGACDAKGIIAAQIAAAEALRESGEASLGLLFVVDEEIGSTGARAANSHPLARSCQWLINGEPTDNKLALGSKGSLKLILRSQGRAGHSAYPEYGESAIEKMMDALARVRSILWPKDEFFGDTTCNIGTLHGGTRPNVIPPEAAAHLQIRLVTDPGPIKQLLEEAITGLAQVEYLSLTERVRLTPVEGFESCIVRFTTDIPHLHNWGVPFLLGPGSVLDAHTEHECLSPGELLRAVNLYVELARRLLHEKVWVSVAPRAEGTIQP